MDQKDNAIAHIAKAFDLHFILNRATLFKCQPDMIINGFKIMCMRMEHLVFLDSVFFLPFARRRLPEPFGLTVGKSWYTHYCNTEENLDYIGPLPDVLYYGVNEMGEGESCEFHEWNVKQEPRLITGACSNNSVNMTLRSSSRRAECFGEK